MNLRWLYPFAALSVLVGIAVTLSAPPCPDPGPTVVRDAACASRLTDLLARHDAGDGVRVLGCDPRGRGRAVVAIGDPATARHVAVLVPGAGIDLATFTGPAGDPERAARRPWAWARALADAAGPDTAVVLWIGYRTPAGVDPGLATGAAARAAVPGLVREVAALGARPSDAPHVTVIGHSYGAVVVALAAPQLAAEDLVLLGSPGARAADVAGLRTRARVHAARLPDDWVRQVPALQWGDVGHGADPAAPDFGADLLAVGDSGGHDGYLRPGSAALRAVTGVVVGRAGPGALG